MSDFRDEIPTMVLLDTDGFLIRVGDPNTINKKEIVKCVREGGTVKTMKFKEYVAADYKWIYDKPKTAKL